MEYFLMLAKMQNINLFPGKVRIGPSSYRHILPLPLIFKIIEKGAHDQTNEFFWDNKIVFNYQSESRTNHLTSLCLYLLTDKILNCFYEG